MEKFSNGEARKRFDKGSREDAVRLIQETNVKLEGRIIPPEYHSEPGSG